MCALIFNIKWIDIVIMFWILDKIITTYYYWVTNYLSLRDDIVNTWNIKCIGLKQAFNNTNTYYEHTANELIDVMNYRDKVILLFKGINLNVNSEIDEDFKKIKFKILQIFYNEYINFWNKYYIEFQMMKGVMWKYYESYNDEDFILKYLHIYIIGSEMDSESFEKKQLLVENILLFHYFPIILELRKFISWLLSQI
jgi:hypothetical protein